MYTITDYLDQLDIDKNTLYGALNTAGVSVQEDDTFTVLTPATDTLVTDTISLIDEINGEVI